MKERPILFNSEMVRAILEGRKTQTRRPVKVQPAGEWAAPGKTSCPFGQIGDRLWVRETFRSEVEEDTGTYLTRYAADGMVIEVNGGWFAANDNWHPSIHMPRWASRILLEITAVRVERVQDITEEGARAEGFVWKPSSHCVDLEEAHTAREDFMRVWNECYSGRGLGWDANPWVWVVEFKIAEIKK